MVRKRDGPLRAVHIEKKKKKKVFLALPRFFIFYNFLLISDLFLSVTCVGRLEGWMDCCVKEIQAKNVCVCV